MEAVVHTGRKPQRGVLAIAIKVHELRIDQQVLQCVGEPLCLDQLLPSDPSARADNRVTRTGDYMGIMVDRPRAGFQLSRKARVQACEALRSRFAEIEIGEPPPYAIEARVSSGASIWLNQPKNRFAR
jgi:hypothetical protein